MLIAIKAATTKAPKAATRHFTAPEWCFPSGRSQMKVGYSNQRHSNIQTIGDLTRSRLTWKARVSMVLLWTSNFGLIAEITIRGMLDCIDGPIVYSACFEDEELD
jgi:hypothetical protein